VALSPDEKVIASGSTSLRLWDAQRQGAIPFREYRRSLCVAFSPTEACRLQWRYAGLFSRGATGKRVRQLDGQALESAACLCSRWKTLVSVAAKRFCGLWDVANARKKATLRGHVGTINAVGVSSRCKIIRPAVPTPAFACGMWRPQGDHSANVDKGPSGGAMSVAFSARW